MATSVEVARAPLLDQGPGDEPRPRHDEDPDADHEIEADGADGKRRRKKRRIIQNSDRKYCCSEEGCGKKYSRAEHLYRHQLNRTSLNSLESRCFNEYQGNVKGAASQGPTLTNTCIQTRPNIYISATTRVARGASCVPTSVLDIRNDIQPKGLICSVKMHSRAHLSLK